MLIKQVEINNSARTKISDTGFILVIPNFVNEHIELYSHSTEPYANSFKDRFDTHEGYCGNKGSELYAISKEQTVKLLVIERDSADSAASYDNTLQRITALEAK